MTDARQIEAVAGILSDPGNAERSAEEVAELVLAEVERFRKRSYKYVVVAQDRLRPTTAALKSGVDNPRQFHPTWVVGPLYTLLEAAAVARPLREKGLRTMTAQIMLPDEEINPDELKEVII